MQALQHRDLLSSDTNAMDQRHALLRQRREAHEPVEHLDAFAQERHRLFVTAEREALSQELSRFDLDVPVVEVDGERSHRVLRCETTSPSAVGPVRVERRWYRPPQGGPTLCPLERRVGIIEGAWTPLAAQQAPWVVAHVTPKEGEELFALLGNMTPSKRTLDRWPKALRAHWETHRPHFAAPLRHQETLPVAAVAMAVSRDGVRAPMQDGARHAKRRPAVAAGPGEIGDVGDGIVAGEIFGLGELAVEHLEQPMALAEIALLHRRKLLGEVAGEDVGLAHHRAEAAHLEHQPLQDSAAALLVRGHEPSRLLGEVDQDGAALEHGEVVIAAVDDGGDAGIGVDGAERVTTVRRRFKQGAHEGRPYAVSIP